MKILRCHSPECSVPPSVRSGTLWDFQTPVKGLKLKLLCFGSVAVNVCRILSFKLVFLVRVCLADVLDLIQLVLTSSCFIVVANKIRTSLMGSIKRRINSRSRSVFSSRRLCRRHRGSHLHIVEGRRRRGRRRGRRAAGCGQTLRQRDRRAHAGGAHQTGAEESRGGRGGPGGRRRPEEKSPDLGVHLGHDAHSSHSRPEGVHQRLHRRREGER